MKTWRNLGLAFLMVAAMAAPVAAACVTHVITTDKGTMICTTC